MNSGPSSKKVLIVEDEKFLATAYEAKLKKAGYEIQIAYDGGQVLEILKNFIPQVIILDLILPIKDGFTVLAELKANPNYAKIPVIIASNLGQQEDIAKGKMLGAADYIVKANMSLGDIVAKVDSIITSSK